MKSRLLFYPVICFLVLTASVKQSLSQAGLEAYITMAVDSNPSLQSRYYEFLSVAEKVNQSGSIPDPTISVAYGLRPVETRLGAQEAKLSVTQMFPWFGTSKAKKESFSHLADSKKEQYHAARNRVILDVKTAYYALYENSKKIEYTQQMIGLMEMLEQLVLTKYENNQTSMVNVIQIQMEKDELADKILQFEETGRTLQTNFNLLLNVPPEMEILLPDTLYTNQDPQAFPVDSVLVNNNEIKAMKHKHMSAEEMTRLSRLNGSPSFGVGLDYSIISKRTDMDLPHNGRDVIMPMASIKLPIYRKKYQSAVEENILNTEGIRYAIRQLENKLILEYQNATENYRDADRKARLYQNQVEKASHALALLITEAETGKSQFDNILKMEQSLIRYRLLFEGANTRKLNAIATLEYLTSY